MTNLPAALTDRASGRVFLDTNILVYADDADQPAKQEVARQVLRRVAEEQRGVLSTQVLMEYVAAGRRRLGLTLGQCRQAVLLYRRFDVVVVQPDHVLGALDLAAAASLSHWDALVVRAASSAGCTHLVTEDLQDGQRIDGLQVVDPFRGC